MRGRRAETLNTQLKRDTQSLRRLVDRAEQSDISRAQRDTINKLTHRIQRPATTANSSATSNPSKPHSNEPRPSAASCTAERPSRSAPAYAPPPRGHPHTSPAHSGRARTTPKAAPPGTAQHRSSKPTATATPPTYQTQSSVSGQRLVTVTPGAPGTPSTANSNAPSSPLTYPNWDPADSTIAAVPSEDLAAGASHDQSDSNSRQAQSADSRRRHLSWLSALRIDAAELVWSTRW